MDNHKEILIHAVKAIQYRFAKAVNGSKEDFGSYKIGEHTRNPTGIINHMFDLASKTKSMIMDAHFNVPAPQLLDFTGERERLLSCLEELKVVMEAAEIDMETGKKLLQGPIMDMATHIGQIAMLNGIHGNKIPGESYYNAMIK